MHIKRWITGIVAVPLLVLLISKGGNSLFAVVVVAVCFISLWEYLCIVLNKNQGFMPKGKSALSIGIHLPSFFLCPFIIWGAYIKSFHILLGIVVLNFIIFSIISLPKFNADPDLLMPDMVFKHILGIIYIPLLISFLVMIRNGANGRLWLYLLLILVFMGDTGAYYIGSYFGKNKLCKKLSPNKTIEGAAGGLVASICAGSLFKYFLMPGLSWHLCILFFLLTGIIGQAGDLFESELKRAGGIKDSGALLPGHGGMLDRIDALLFAAPLVFFFKEYVF